MLVMFVQYHHGICFALRLSGFARVVSNSMLLAVCINECCPPLIISRSPRVQGQIIAERHPIM
jgi:hypothetical protein